MYSSYYRSDDDYEFSKFFSNRLAEFIFGGSLTTGWMDKDDFPDIIKQNVFSRFKRKFVTHFSKK